MQVEQSRRCANSGGGRGGGVPPPDRGDPGGPAPRRNSVAVQHDFSETEICYRFLSLADVSDTDDVNHIRSFNHPQGLFIATFKTMSPACHMVMAACRLVFSQRWDGVHAFRSGHIRNISADKHGFAHGNAAWPNICSPFLATMYSDALRLFDVRREFLIGEVPHRARNFFSSRDVAVSWTCGHPVLCADDGWYTGYHWAASIKTMV